MKFSRFLNDHMLKTDKKNNNIKKKTNEKCYIVSKGPIIYVNSNQREDRV